jgi:hypothetical protein
MAGRGAQTFQKRQKELQRKERQQEKRAKKLERKSDPNRPDEDDSIGENVLMIEAREAAIAAKPGLGND